MKNLRIDGGNSTIIVKKCKEKMLHSRMIIKRVKERHTAQTGKGDIACSVFQIAIK